MVVLSLISAIGLGLGKIHICGISLGVTFVFFAGILAGHFGLSIDPQMLNYAESFGLIIFVYALGLQVGPGFFSSFRKGGVQLNMLALGVVLLGTSDDRIGQLYPEYFVAGHGGHPLRRYHQYAGAGCGTADIEANGDGSQYAGFGMCRGISAGGSGRYFCPC